MAKTLMDKLTAEEEKLYQQERLIFWCSELICEEMEKQEMTCADMAKKIGKSRQHVSRLLDGSRGISLRALSDMFWALDVSPSVTLGTMILDIC